MSILLYLAVGRLVKEQGEYAQGKHEIIASAAHPTVLSQEKDFSGHAQKLMDNGASKLVVGKRIRLICLAEASATTSSINYDLHVMPESLGDSLLIYFAVTSTEFGKAQSIQKLLDEFKAGFLNINRQTDIEKARARGPVHNASAQLLDKLFQQFSTNKLADVQGKVNQVKSVMQQNVNAALSNMEALSELEDKSENFENQARTFQKSATDVKRKMRCRNIKMTLVLVSVVVIIITIIVLVNVPMGGGSSSSSGDGN